MMRLVAICKTASDKFLSAQLHHSKYRNDEGRSIYYVLGMLLNNVAALTLPLI